ncbi:SDR family NAD(P)-dependent oxidoreductase [Serratia symbiotica]|uniref:SDR family NAD(P)-dependent oxidoreductase n=1 Tax=Serratia symbiotica TaxID=138074 RepID=UPI002091D4C9|nr:SDR family NAD(P)-dependent oxidoreductase [Serratia symbiotica]USS95096.1 SDR family NAD(P)-dependent oxidoreductase [Serratia symbiotica]
MMNSITEKVVVITGASSGLGEATVRLLSERGAKVVLAARRADRLENLVKDIKKAGGEALTVITDVAKRDDMENIIRSAEY